MSLIHFLINIQLFLASKVKHYLHHVQSQYLYIFYKLHKVPYYFSLCVVKILWSQKGHTFGMCTILLISINNLIIFSYIITLRKTSTSMRNLFWIYLFFIHSCFSCSYYRKDFSVIKFASDLRIKKYTDFEWKCCLFFGCSWILFICKSCI